MTGGERASNTPCRVCLISGKLYLVLTTVTCFIPPYKMAVAGDVQLIFHCVIPRGRRHFIYSDELLVTAVKRFAPLPDAGIVDAQVGRFPHATGAGSSSSLMVYWRLACCRRIPVRRRHPARAITFAV
ncbi:hypothetical protein KCP75_21030 [Salmonella enterica subsp. enterica]|nr:hypothetical protein KCP75_21030 [Salmonella enterica subsp. enterica]